MSEQSESAGAQAQNEGGAYREWSAILDLMPGGSDPRKLRVGGEYRLNRRSGTVQLRKRVPQGFIPETLLLDLVIEGSGPGGDWVAVEEEFEATQGQYEEVRVQDENGEEVVLKVQEVH
ncbi:MAG TPA: hypothetical protein VF704_00310 [Allosphingosinicella sp.]|jgi:hypothetical protein